MANGSLRGADLAPDSLGGAQINEGSLGTVRTAVRANRLGNIGPGGYRRYAGTIPSGQTITGTWGCTHSASPAYKCAAIVSLPLPVSTRGFVVDVDVEQAGRSFGVWAYTAP